MQFIFWQNIVSPHQAAMLRSLAGLGHDVRLIVEHDLSEHRREMGWTTPDCTGVHVTMTPSARQIASAITDSSGTALHIFSGTVGSRLVRIGLTCALTRGRRIALMVESPNSLGWRGLVRRSRDWVLAQGLRSKVHFVLAMGRRGTCWYERAGYHAEKVFEYGYCVEAPNTGSRDVREYHEDRARLVMVAQCIPRKGLDLAIRALKPLRHVPWTLEVIGDGPVRKELEALTSYLGLERRIQFRGARSNAQTVATIALSDLLILPSRHDGWGAVVNESLMLGTPVLATTGCGASSLLSSSNYGIVVEAGMVKPLVDGLRNRLERGRFSNEERDKLRHWASCLRGEALAGYLVDIVEHLNGNQDRPLAPWRQMPYRKTP